MALIPLPSRRRSRHADQEEQAGHHFEAACVAPLRHLTSFTLSEFVSADLTALPITLRKLDLFVFHNEPLRLPPALQLETLDLMGSTM